MGFADSFWCADDSAYDRMVMHLKATKKVSKDIEEYFKQRARIEEEYARALQKLPKPDFIEFGSFGSCCAKMHSTINKTAEIHSQLAQQLFETSARMGQFTADQSRTKKEADDKLRAALSDKNKAMKRVDEAQKAYYDPCRTEEDLRHHLESIDSQATSNLRKAQKEKEKVIRKLQDTRISIDRTHDYYKKCIEESEHFRKIWEREHQAAFEKFERLELGRMEYSRNVLWLATNLEAVSLADQDDALEDFRKIMELCNPASDNFLFEGHSGTGEKPPAGMKYKPYVPSQSASTTISRQ